MNRIHKIIFCILALICLNISNLSGHGSCAHIAIGRATYDVWINFDRAFYDSLTTAPANYQQQISKMKVLKFYYIGLILPDLFWSYQQTTAKGLIDIFHALGNNVVDPLKINNVTYNNTREPLNFPDHHNLSKLRQMTEYARNQNWPACEKALIYGAYMHVIQDIYVHTILQPSRFGFGFALDSDSALAEPILRFAELYHEIFTETHVTEWFEAINILYYGVKNPRTENPQLRHAPMQFYREHNDDGQFYESWQNMDFPPVQRFVQSANAIGIYGNITQERLESYLHGWAMLHFLQYGYRSNGGDVGGIFSHPNWTHYEIRSFIADIGDDFPNSWLIGIPGADDIVRWIVREIIKIGAGIFVLHLPLDEPWPAFLESATLFREIWPNVMPEYLLPEIHRAYEKFHRNLWYWNQHAAILPPWSRNSYNQEVSDASLLRPLHTTSLHNGEVYLDYNMNGVDIWTLSRKAGLTGGIYVLPNANYIRQPGVINAGFKDKRNGNLLWVSPLTLPQGDPTVNFFYDLITFGNTKISVIGRTESGNEIEIESRYYTDIGRYRDSFPVNLQPFWSQGIRDIYFKIYTRAISGTDYKEMLSSYYADAYNSTPAIHENALYQQWFNSGNPLRTQAQNPFSNPKQFWPYAIAVTPSNVWHLNIPTSLTGCINSQYLFIDLNWTDNSNHEHHFEIKRINLDYNDSTTFVVNGSQGTGLVNWTDENAEVGYAYRYFVRAKREQWYSDWSNPVDYSLTFSDSVPITAYNHANKVTKFCNNVHLTYFGQNPSGNERVIYLNSTDGGNNWNNIENVSQPELCGMFPTIACDNLGNPYIVWAEKWQWHFVYDGKEPPRSYWKTQYFLAKKENNQWQNSTIEAFMVRDSSGQNRPSFELLQPSFAIRHDTGFIAYVMPDEQGLQYNLNLDVFLLTNTVRIGHYQLSSSCDTINYPSLLVDGDGRIVITQSFGNFIKIWYLDNINEPASSFTINNLVSVHNLSASLEQGKNILLAWVNTTGDEAINFRRLIKQPNGSYQASMIETVMTDMGAWHGVHPKIVNTNLFPCLILYEGLRHPSGPYCIFYAFRTGENKWRVKPINSESNLFQSIYPQGFISGNWLTTYWTGTNETYSPLYLRNKKVNLLPDFLSTFYVACDMATGPNNGTHLMRVPNSKELYMVFQEQNHIYFSHSYDEGENWETELIDDGLYPCIGLNNQGQPWIAYVKDGDILCKMKRADESWKDILIFDGNENLFAGPPSMHLATMPIKEGVKDYAYITYPVYEGTMPENIVV